MPALPARRVVPYNEARDLIRDGDVLLWRGHGLIARMIRVAGRSLYSHAGMAGWDRRDPDRPALMCYEVREFIGPRISRLAHQVDMYPGQIHVYRVSDTHTELHWAATNAHFNAVIKYFDSLEAVSVMRDIAKPGKYGWWHLFLTGLIHMPGIRMFFLQPVDDTLVSKRAPYCSHAVSASLRKAFTDVVRHTPDNYTHPGDLDKSPLLHYMLTLARPETNGTEK
jgi:hypothetical protein